MDIVGIAISMNIMAFIGLIFALNLARNYVDVPIVKTFAPPLIAAATGIGLHVVATEWLNTLPTLAAFIAGSAIFTLGYAAGLLIVERKTLLGEIETIINTLKT
jgi:hypothetical protein